MDKDTSPDAQMPAAALAVSTREVRVGISNSSRDELLRLLLLLQQVPRVYECTSNEVLVSALAVACHRWTNSTSMLLDIEGHGREDLFEDIDLSRTVGWFTCIHPVRIDLTAFPDRSKLLAGVMQTIRSVPRKGVGYGVLRYLSSAADAGLIRTAPPVRLCFNNFGQFGRALTRDSAFRFAQGSAGELFDREDERYYDVLVGTMISRDQLHVNFLYSSNVHHDQTMNRFAADFVDELHRLLAKCAEAQH